MNIYAKAEGTRMVVEIDGAIGGYDWESDRMNTAARIKRELKKVEESEAEEVVVRINSLGGYVSDGIAIFEALNQIRGKVTTEMVGHCASAATIIAMGGESRKMSKYGLMLIHRSWCGAEGNAIELQRQAEELETIDKEMLKIYTDASGKKAEEIESLMDANEGRGKWITAEEALEMGFVTEITDGNQASNDLGRMVMAAAGLPEPPEGYLFEKEINLNTNTNTMKLIESYALIGAVVPEAELEKNGCARMDSEALAAVEACMAEMKTKAEEAEAKVAEMEAKLAEAEAKAEQAVKDLEEAKAAFEAKQTKDEQIPEADRTEKVLDSWEKYCQEHSIN